LQVGYSGLLGVGLAALPTRAAPARRPKSVILVFLTGAASHLDTFDLKPEAPPEVRGEFTPIPTSVPGIRVCEHLPLTAARADRYALVRTLSHRENNHLVATHHVLTGHPQPGAFFDKVASRDDWPCYASGLGCLRPRADGLPGGVHLPTFLVEGPLTWPASTPDSSARASTPGRSPATRASPTSAWTTFGCRRGWRWTGSATGVRCSTR
jgi:hypothetical protein